MDKQERIPLPWLKLYKDELEDYHNGLTPDEFYYVLGEALVAFLNDDEIALPVGTSSGVKLALSQFRKKVDKAREKYVSTKEDGAKGGKKKAENARKKAAEAAEKGVYTPPKKTQFLTLCKDVLHEFGRNSAWELSLSLKQEDRPGLYDTFCEDQEERPARNAEEVKAFILCHAAANYWMDNSLNGDDQCFRLYNWLYEHGILSPGELAEAIQHFDVSRNGSVCFGLEEDEGAIPIYYETAEAFLTEYYKEDSTEDPPAAPDGNLPVFHGWGKV